ncbi:MAG: hypothetical protein VB051_05500 [Candidatus Pelethousia sp.]|nr:hypothetical protein [Candidatus Pelethousia sp.]
MKIKRGAFILSICFVLFGVICCVALPHEIIPSQNPLDNVNAGGMSYSPLRDSNEYIPAMNQDISRERFQRPSKALPYPNPYTYGDFSRGNEKPPPAAKKFENPEDLILAYYGILREASNMLGYSGGCGTVGWSGLPYPYAYELLTEAKKKEVPFDRYVDSFIGIGYTTLLKLLPAYAPPGTPHSTKYYMVEIEMITGVKANTDNEYKQGSQFSYHYGLVAVEKTLDKGWRIKNIYYIAEDFLCAPMHSWFYLSDAVVQIVYGDNLKLIDKIDRTEKKDDMINIYASGKGKSYRFDFVRLTNGYDILLHEYILDHEDWQETSLLCDNWMDMKLTINNSQLYKTT